MSKNNRRMPLNALLNKIQEKFFWHPKLRSLAISLYSRLTQNNNTLLNKNNVEKDLINLKDNGYVEFPPISQDLIDRVLDRIKDCELYDPWGSVTKTFKYSSIPDGTHVAKVKNPAQVDEAVKILLQNQHVLDVCGSYFNCKFVIDCIDIWWSIPTGSQQEAEFFHRDKDSLNFLKWFVYLTDVDLEAGPHEFAIGSVNANKFTRSGRFTDEEICGSFSSKKFVGAAGTNFLENTYGLHRGTPPKVSYRALLQFRFSVNPSTFRYKGTQSALAPSHPSVKESFI